MKNKNALSVLIFALILVVIYLYCLYPLAGTSLLSFREKVIILAGAMISFVYIAKVLLGVSIIPVNTENKSNVAGRKIGLDMLRVFAIMMVITVHFIIAQGYYANPIAGKKYYFASMARWLAQTCCPIFMILSGYFLSRMKTGKKHFKSIIKFLRNYFVIVVIFVIYHKKYDMEAIKQLVNLNYMWYVNMYFGLLLISPYINQIIDQWDQYSKAVKTILCFFILASFGTITHEWFSNYWFGLYPILYYFIGAFFRKFEIKNIGKVSCFSIILILLMLQAAYTFFSGYGEIFDWARNMGGYSCAYNATPTLICTVCLFQFFKDISLENKRINKVLEIISKQSLEIYLLVCMFVGDWVYQPLFEVVFVRYGVVYFWMVIVIVEIIIGTVLGWILNFALNNICGLIHRGCMKNCDFI